MQHPIDMLSDPMGSIPNSSHALLSRTRLSQQYTHETSNWFGSEDLPFLHTAQPTDTLESFFATPLLSHAVDQRISNNAYTPQFGFRIVPSPGPQNVLLAEPLSDRNLVSFDEFINIGGEDAEEVENELEPPGEEQVTTQRRRIRSAEWEKHRQILRKLYLEDNRSAKETREYMIRNHQFQASIKAYKNKFSEWKWTKNLNPLAARHMLAVAENRKRDSNKDTKFAMGGQQFTLERVERCLQRAKPSVRDLNQPAEDERSLAAFRYWTPSNLSSPAYQAARMVSSPLRPYVHQIHVAPRNPAVEGYAIQPLSPGSHLNSSPVSSTDSNEEETGQPPVQALQTQPTLGEDRLEYAQGRVKLGDRNVEPFLVTFLADADEPLARRLQAGAALMDLHSMLGSALTDKALLELRNVLKQALHGKHRSCFRQFQCLVALSGRFALHGRYKDAASLFKEVEHLADRVLFGNPNEFITMLVCFGRLLAQNSPAQAKTYFHHAISLALSAGHKDCTAVHRLQSVSGQSCVQQPLHGAKALCCRRVCFLESKVFDADNEITPQSLDSLFYTFC